MEFKRLVHSKVKTIGGYVFRPTKFVPFFHVARFQRATERDAPRNTAKDPLFCGSDVFTVKMRLTSVDPLLLYGAMLPQGVRKRP